MRLLFIGNSFTMGSGSKAVLSVGGVPGLVRELAVAAGHPRPFVQMAAKGGRHFSDHLSDETGAMTAIREGNWDAAVLQEFSTGPTRIGDPEAFRTNARTLHDAMLKQCPTCTIVLYQTWAREPSHPMVSGATRKFPGGWMQMQEELCNGYVALARELGPHVRTAPVGRAWQLVLSSSRNMKLHADDDYHAGTLGSYLAAIVLFETLYGSVPASLPSLLDVSSEDAAYLQAVAMAARAEESCPLRSSDSSGS